MLKMSTMLYGICSRELIFKGKYDAENLNKDAFYWYEGNDREESLEIARKYSDDDTINVWKVGIVRNVYQWNAFEIEDDEIINCKIKIFDPLDRFKWLKTFATSAYKCKCDLISYIIGEREFIGEFMRGNHVCALYRYEDTAFGDFTAYEEEGRLWLPKHFCDYDIMSVSDLMLTKGECTEFWQDWEIEDPEMKLLYQIFQNY